jgi:hypothetical protein
MPSGIADAGHVGLQLLRQALDALRDERLADVPASSLGEELTEIEALTARLRHEQARRAAAFDSAGGAAADGFASTGAWLRANTLASPREAGDLVNVGRDLRDRLPSTRAVLDAGGMSFAGATAISRALRDVRDETVLREADAVLAQHAPTLHPAQVAHAARRVLEHLDPQLAQRDAAQRWADRTLSLAPVLDGAVAVSGQMDEYSAAVVLSALTPLMTPRGPEDARSAGQRRLDALVELVGKAAQTGAAGTMTSTGLPPTLLVRVDVERLAQLDPPPGAIAPRRTEGDPGHGGGSATSAAPAELEWGGPILDDTLRRIGCGAQLVRLVTAGASRVLDLGRARRLASPAQNLARLARDRGCLFAGCDRPPEWTEAHHVRPWSEGGATDLEGLLSFCAFHHHLLHEGGWTLRPGDAEIEIRRPGGRLHSTIAGLSPGMARGSGRARAADSASQAVAGGDCTPGDYRPGDYAADGCTRGDDEPGDYAAGGPTPGY